MPAIPSSPVAKVGISGLGRIGRAAFRASLDREDVQVVAINHTAPDLDYLLYAISFDSTHGRCAHTDHLAISADRQALEFHGRRITLFSQRDPTLIDWRSAGAEYVVESTGKFRTVASAGAHLASAKKVVISAPSKDAKTFVVGVNEHEYEGQDVLSNASCTTNCLAPLARVLDESFGIEWGLLTTVHAATSSQAILDGFSKKSKRLGRGLMGNLIPTSTGASEAVQLVYPALAGKFKGMSLRVPVSNVSMIDLTVTLSRPANSIEELLAPMREAAASRLDGVLCVIDQELVSSDFLGFRQSTIIDAPATIMLSPTVFKIIAFYDNEYGYSCRILDLIAHMYAVDNHLA